MMKQNPAAYRRTTNSSMTDEQILAQANQLEQLASNPAMRKQQDAFNKLIQAMNEKQRDIWNKCFTGTYVPTVSEMATMQPLLKEQREIIKTIGASISPALGGQITPERVDAILDQTIGADPKFLVAMFSFALTLRKWWAKLNSIFGKWTVPVLVVIVLIILYFIISWTWRFIWWLLSLLFGSSNADNHVTTTTPTMDSSKASSKLFEHGDEDDFGDFGGDDDFFDD